MSGGDYVAAAYLVVLAFVLVYVVIIALKLSRLDRDLDELTHRARERRADNAPERERTRVG